MSLNGYSWRFPLYWIRFRRAFEETQNPLRLQRPFGELHDKTHYVNFCKILSVVKGVFNYLTKCALFNLLENINMEPLQLFIGFTKFMETLFFPFCLRLFKLKPTAFCYRDLHLSSFTKRELKDQSWKHWHEFHSLHQAPSPLFCSAGSNFDVALSWSCCHDWKRNKVLSFPQDTAACLCCNWWGHPYYALFPPHLNRPGLFLPIENHLNTIPQFSSIIIVKAHTIFVGVLLYKTWNTRGFVRYIKFSRQQLSLVNSALGCRVAFLSNPDSFRAMGYLSGW